MNAGSRLPLVLLTRLVRVLACAFAAALSLLALPVHAGYPERPIRLIVPFPAGGGADNLARLIMPHVGQQLGAPIVIDNRPGAGGNVGAELVAHAVPDGYTLLYGTNGTHAINQALYGNLRFDPVKDFAPVSRMTQIAAMLTVTPALAVSSVPDLLQYARTHPGKLNFASAGNGTTSHLAGELLKSMGGIDMVHVPYRGGALAAADVMSGQVEIMIDVMPNVLPLVRGGKLRGLAVTTGSRFPTAAEYPTIRETGVPGFEMSAWDGVFAPAGTPRAIIDRLNAAIRAALDVPELREMLLSRGAQPVAGTPEDLAQHVVAESAKWAKVVRAAGAHVD